MKLAAILFLFLAAAISGDARPFQDQDTTPVDPIEHLHLTPEQRQKIRIITQETRDERQTTNRRVREARIALDQALDAQAPDENLIEQRASELVAAQAAQLRMRIQTELRIRRELNPEQLAALRSLRRQLRDVRGVQRTLNQRRGRQGLRLNQRNRALSRPNIPPQ
ncbi:MAG TPA: periplasmic heavy metal sensor [Pyrinomonadaceae bacterium]|nr:periplasmic heavy metal sensor [Pyrinomonadaceae bacterium]